MVRVTAVVLEVTTSPEASSIVTCGWVREGHAAGGAGGCCVKTSLVAVPATVNEVLVAVIGRDRWCVAFRVKDARVPSVILQPAKVATPSRAVSGLRRCRPACRSSVDGQTADGVGRRGDEVASGVLHPHHGLRREGGATSSSVVGETWKAILSHAPATVKDALVPVARVRVVSVAVEGEGTLRAERDLAAGEGGHAIRRP